MNMLGKGLSNKTFFPVSSKHSGIFLSGYSNLTYLSENDIADSIFLTRGRVGIFSILHN